MKEYLNLLNDKQKEACIDTKGPSLIVAGAGSGKTKVLTSRIAYLIDNDGVDPSNILAITFTNKAAREMQERVDSLVGGKNRITCKTFHSFCALLLRSEIGVLENRKRSFQIIDDDETETLIKDVMTSLNYDTKLFKPSTMANCISQIKSRIKDENSFEGYNREKIINTMNRYNSELIKNNLVDFDDLLCLTVEIFENYPQVLNKYQEQYKYILVDEFQDTSNIQYALIELLGSKYKNVFVVGDEDQSIYSFRGANIGNIRKFMDSFSGYHKHILDENYRSTQSILNCANKLISNNEDRIEKNLWTSRGDGEAVSLMYYDSDSLEAKSISDTIKMLVELKGYKYSDFAIIYRNNYLSRNFEERLMIERIPYRIYSGMSFYKREEVKDMLSYLRLILNPNDFYSFKRALARPKRGIGDTTLNRIENELDNNDGSIIEAIKSAKIYDKPKLLLLEFMDMIHNLRSMFDSLTLKEFFNQVYEKTGYKAMISELDDKEKRQTKADNIQELLNAIVSVETVGNLEETLSDFLQTVSLLTELDIESSDDNHVSLITMHSAKGLEYRCVFACGLEDDILPGLRAMNKDDFEEERRILYVCLTRAMENLYISCSTSRYKFGSVNHAMPSRFLKELDIPVRSSKIYKKETPNSKIVVTPARENETKKGEFEVGQKVYHEVFKNGAIIGNVEGYYIIRFDGVPSPKKVIIGHPLLKKI